VKTYRASVNVQTQLLVLTYCNSRLQNRRVDTQNPLEIAKGRLGLTRIAEICQVSREAARKWLLQGHLPRTEWSGETDYARIIAMDYARHVAADPQPALEVPACTAELLLSVRPNSRQPDAATAACRA
jgi:hypothetical protein